ncbi:unnamed protein product [Pleuronectes platessa]|uniref:Uncharacterized protein n=1 Tax=Pleuronectes platessa TaxID=8262 RepID=A0A9N7VGW6_PLEPL|nr:unnamed protein product [Pleuronectes platessa]
MKQEPLKPVLASGVIKVEAYLTGIHMVERRSCDSGPTCLASCTWKIPRHPPASLSSHMFTCTSSLPRRGRAARPSVQAAHLLVRSAISSHRSNMRMMDALAAEGFSVVSSSMERRSRFPSFPSL